MNHQIRDAQCVAFDIGRACDQLGQSDDSRLVFVDAAQIDGADGGGVVDRQDVDRHVNRVAAYRVVGLQRGLGGRLTVDADRRVPCAEGEFVLVGTKIVSRVWCVDDLGEAVVGQEQGVVAVEADGIDAVPVAAAVGAEPPGAVGLGHAGQRDTERVAVGVADRYGTKQGADADAGGTGDGGVRVFVDADGRRPGAE